MPQNLSKTTTDHETIRRWTEERGGWPAEVESTAREGQTGILRIDFPGWSGEGTLRRIDWDEWLRKFDESGLAFVYEEATSGGERSSFNKLVARETASARARGARSSRRGGRSGAARSRSAGPARRGGRAGARAGAKTSRRAGARKAMRSSGRRQTSRAQAARTAGRRTRRGARRSKKK